MLPNTIPPSTIQRWRSTLPTSPEVRLNYRRHWNSKYKSRAKEGGPQKISFSSHLISSPSAIQTQAAESMGKPASGRDWIQIYAVYGTDEWQTVAFLSFHAAAFSAVAILVLLYFTEVILFFQFTFPNISLSLLRFSVGFAGSVAAISGLCLLCAAMSVLHSSLSLRWEMAQRMVAAVTDWSGVRTALDVGCGRGILLNAVAARMKKEGTGGRVVGLERRREAAVSVLRRAGAEGVGEQVTFREGEARALPFGDGYFDVVVSAVHFSGLGAEERGRGMGEVVRVLKPGGVGIVWDLMCGPELAHRLREMRMEDVRVSERVTAFLVASHVVSFRKPLVDAAVPADWRAVICC